MTATASQSSSVRPGCLVKLPIHDRARMVVRSVYVERVSDCGKYFFYVSTSTFRMTKAAVSDIAA